MSELQELQAGTYLIVSKLSEQTIGRRDREDKSNNPKPIVNRPQGLEPQQVRLITLLTVCTTHRRPGSGRLKGARKLASVSRLVEALLPS